MTDWFTRTLLVVIAVALWLHLFRTWDRPGVPAPAPHTTADNLGLVPLADCQPVPR